MSLNASEGPYYINYQTTKSWIVTDDTRFCSQTKKTIVKTNYQHKKLFCPIKKKKHRPRRYPSRIHNKSCYFQHWCCEGIEKEKKLYEHARHGDYSISHQVRFSFYPPTHEPQSPAPGEPSGLSKWPFTKTDGSESCESSDDILPLNKT